MPNGFTWKEWQREKTRPLTRSEQEVLVHVVNRPVEHHRWNVFGGDAHIGYLLTERKLIVPMTIDPDYNVTAKPTAFGRLVAHAHEAVNLCHAHPLDHEPQSLFKMDCPECNGTGAEEPDCWLCKGERRIKEHAAYRHGYKKADLQDLEDDGWCDCPACHGECCDTCQGDGTVPADYLWREAQRVLLSEDASTTGPFPVIRWTGDSYMPGLIDEDALLSNAALEWLHKMGWSSGLYSDMLSQWFYLRGDAEQVAAAVLKPTETADIVRMWRAGDPWKPARKSGDFRTHERDLFEEAAAFHRCFFRGWIGHDWRDGAYAWTDEGRDAIAGWDGAEIRLERERLDDPAGALRIMERVSSARRAVARAELAVIRSAERLEVAQARLDAAEHRGDPGEVQHRRRRLEDALSGFGNHRLHVMTLDSRRRDLAWALRDRAREEGLEPANKDQTYG